MATIKIKIAESWNELSDSQLKKLAKLFYDNRLKPSQLFDVKVWQILNDRDRFNAMRVLKQVAVSELKTFFPFIYKEMNRTKFLPEIKLAGQKWYPPMDRLTNINAFEFAAAEDLHRGWLTTFNRENLEYLAAVLYSTDARIRPKFEKVLLPDRAALFKKLPLEDLLAIELCYAGCKDAIVKRYPVAFPKSNGLSKGTAKGPGFGEVILRMAGQKFGDHEKTGETNIYTFLSEFQDNLKEAKKNGKANRQ